MSSIRIGIVTVSDRASAGIYEDKGGPAIRATLGDYLTSAWEAVARVIPDDLRTITGTICELADKQACCLIVTTGGTGPSPRDVTPEATAAACTRMLPGFGEQMPRRVADQGRDRDPVAADRRYSRSLPGSESARQAECHP
jgi:molybdopterin adenylyltransferase